MIDLMLGTQHYENLRSFDFRFLVWLVWTKRFSTLHQPPMLVLTELQNGRLQWRRMGLLSFLTRDHF